MKEYAAHTPRPFGKTEPVVAGVYGFVSTFLIIAAILSVAPDARDNTELIFLAIWAAGSLAPWAIVRGAQHAWDGEVLRQYLADSNADEIELSANATERTDAPIAAAARPRPGTEKRLAVLALSFRQSDAPQHRQIGAEIEHELAERYGLEIGPEGRLVEVGEASISGSSESVYFGRIGGFPRPTTTDEAAAGPQPAPAMVASFGAPSGKAPKEATGLNADSAGSLDAADVAPPEPAISNEPDAIFAAPQWDGVRHLPFKAVYYDCWDMYRDDTLYPIGCYGTLVEAEAACKAFIDSQMLDDPVRPAQVGEPPAEAQAPPPTDIQRAAEGLVDSLLTSGTMPMILGGQTPSTFSGLDYARARAVELVRATMLPPATA